MALLETTSEALRSQLLNTESRNIELEKQQQRAREAAAQEAEAKKHRDLEIEMAKKRMEDALAAKSEASEMVETLKKANLTLQKGCEVLQDQVVSHQKRADKADMRSLQIREEQHQNRNQTYNTQRAVALSQVSAHNFDDLCSLLVAELCYENLISPTSTTSMSLPNDENNKVLVEPTQTATKNPDKIDDSEDNAEQNNSWGMPDAKDNT